MAERFAPTDAEELSLNHVLLQVQTYMDRWSSTHRIWKLVPVRTEDDGTKSSLPQVETIGIEDPPEYDGVSGEAGTSGLGTFVTEVTTVTTRKVYRA